MSPATDTGYENTVAEEVCKSGTLATVAADINHDLSSADHVTLGNDDVTCVA